MATISISWYANCAGVGVGWGGVVGQGIVMPASEPRTQQGDAIALDR
jgi:hypothetical protein